jgi:hypothetical protein
LQKELLCSISLQYILSTKIFEIIKPSSLFVLKFIKVTARQVNKKWARMRETFQKIGDARLCDATAEATAESELCDRQRESRRCGAKIFGRNPAT